MLIINPDWVRLRLHKFESQLEVVQRVRSRFKFHLMKQDRDELLALGLITKEQDEQGIRLTFEELEDLEIRLCNRVIGGKCLLRRLLTMNKGQISRVLSLLRHNVVVEKL
jgi:hypothetical protein